MPDTARPLPPRRPPARAATLFLLACAAACLGGCRAIIGGGPGSCSDGLWAPPDAELRRSVARPGGAAAPLYLVRFDRDGGACETEMADELVAAVRSGKYTDVYVLCPGWTPGWFAAAGWVDSFAAGVEQARTWLPPARAQPQPQPATAPAGGTLSAATRPAAYAPLYVGVIWPADVMVDAYPPPSASGRPRSLRPDVDREALTEVLGTDLDARQLARIEQALLDRGHDGRATRLRNLLTRAATLTPPEQLELADCLLPLYGPQEEPSVPGPRHAVTAGRGPVPRLPRPTQPGLLDTEPTPLPPIDPAALLETWKQAVREVSAEIPRPAERPGDGASRASRRGLSVPELVHWALRATDLRVVKDRAYAVGQGGLGELMAGVRSAAAGKARVHLVAHSFGGEAALSALVRSNDAPPVDSLLLISPVVSAWAFAPAPVVAPNVAPQLQQFARPGGYRPAVTDGVRRSVVVVHSTRDWFAAYYAPRALRRPPLEGQAPADAWAGPGAGFAVMGGVGVGGTDPATYREPLAAPAAGPDGPPRYGFPLSGSKVAVIDASAMVNAHGEANDRNVWWLVANQAESRE